MNLLTGLPWESIDGFTRALTAPVAGGILLNQLDELFIDANYFLRGLHRRSRRAVTWNELERVEQKQIAILVPAWQEADVIRRMLEHNLGSFDYDRSRYTIFCGTYQNDPDTQREVDAVARRSPNVVKVVVPHAGPTSKADCLNWVYQGIVMHEQKRGRRFDILLMQDAEDIIHPLALRLYSLLIPKHDFVQTPVFSLELPLGRAVAATYIDEFAEHHLKDMLVREAIGGLVPSAGVGSAFRRSAFEEIARAHGERPFNVESLTEDYEIGLKFRLAGKRVHFACRSVEVRGPAGEVSGARRPRREEIVATREYFPSGFRASVRQRSRWILGITLQTWWQIGWKGPLPVLYCLWRDRKALFTNALLALAYLLVAIGVLRAAAAAAGVAPPLATALAGLPRALRVVLVVNLCAMVWRAGMKASLVGRLYGWGHALVSPARLVLGNLISLAATARAVTTFVKHRFTGAPLRWLKTAHAFPSVEVLREQHRRIGEMLVERHGLPAADLEEALSLQQELGRPLGEVLTLLGAVSATDVTDALAELHGLASCAPDPATAPALALARLPEADAERLGVVPIASGSATSVRCAAAGPLRPEELAELEGLCGVPVEIVLAPAEQVRWARRLAYRRLIAGDASSVARPRARAVASISVEDVDAVAVARLGLGFCSLYGCVPLLDRDAAPGARRPIAAAFPLHEAVVARIEEHVRGPIRVVPAAALELDVALALLVEQGRRAYDARALVTSANTLEVLEALERDGSLAPDAAAKAWAAALGLPTVEPDLGPVDWPLLPPDLRRAHAVVVRSLASYTLVLATARPTPQLARTVASLYPGWAIAWEVILPLTTSSAPHTKEISWTAKTFEALTN